MLTDLIYAADPARAELEIESRGREDYLHELRAEHRDLYAGDEYEREESPGWRCDEIEAWSTLCPEGYDVRRPRHEYQGTRFDFPGHSDQIDF